MKHTTRHSSLTRIIAIGMVCLFLVNSISWAYPDIRTNTLAPKSLVTHEDKALSFQKFAVAYITTKLYEKDEDEEDKATLPAVEDLWLEIIENPKTAGLSQDALPKKIGKPTDGAIRIVFASGYELLFYDPHIEETHDNFHVWYYNARRKKEIEGDMGINQYLRQQFIRGESGRAFQARLHEERIRLIEKYRRKPGFYKLSHLQSTDETFYRVLHIAEALENIKDIEVTIEAFEERLSTPMEQAKSLLMKRTNIDADIAISLKDKTGRLASGKYLVKVKGGKTANKTIDNFFKEKTERLKQWSRYRVVAEKEGFKGVIIAMDKDTPYYPKGKIIEYEDEPWFYLFFGPPGAPKEARLKEKISRPNLMGDRVYINLIRKLARDDTPPHELLRVDRGPGLHGGVATLEVAKEGLSSTYARYLVSQAIKIYRVLTEPDFNPLLLQRDASLNFGKEQKETLRELAGILMQDEPELCEVYMRATRNNRNTGKPIGLSVLYQGENGSSVHGFIPIRYIPESVKKKLNKIKKGKKIYAYLIRLQDGYRPIFAIGLDKARAESKAVKKLRRAFDKQKPVEVTILKRSYNNKGWVVSYKDVIKWGFLPDKEIAVGTTIAEGKTIEVFVHKIKGYPNIYAEFSMKGIDITTLGAAWSGDSDIRPSKSDSEPLIQQRFGKVSDRKLRKEGYRYYMIQSGKKRYFYFRWNIFASLDDQIIGNIKEREWLIETLKNIKEIQDILKGVKGIKAEISDENNTKIEKTLKQILKVIGKPRIQLPDKQRAAGYIKAASADYKAGELKDMRKAYRNLSLTLKYLNTRKEEIERIYERLRYILGWARKWAEETNTYMARLAKSRETKLLYQLANRDEIKIPENEPEFERLEPLIRGAIRHIKSGAKVKSEIINANLKRVEDEINTANFLSQFMAEFKDAYYDARYSGENESCYEKAFFETWIKYSKESNIVRGSPAYWYARFYQAAFIHRTIPNPEKHSERISNPLFEASTILIQMLKIHNFDSILTTRSLLPKKSFSNTRTLIEKFKKRKKRNKEERESLYDLSQAEKHDVIRELAREMNLSRKGLITLNKCAKIFFRDPIIPLYPERLLVVQKLIKECKLDSVLAGKEKPSIEKKLAREYLNVIVTEQELRDLLIRFKASQQPISELEYFLQKEILGYFLTHTRQILNEVKDGFASEKEKVHELFMTGIRVYKFPLIKSLIIKRKELLVDFLLPNIHPSKMKLAKSSLLRSIEARELMINEVLADKDKTIFQPALEVVIELLAEGEEKHIKNFFNAFYPLLKASAELPRFTKALVDVLHKARHEEIQLIRIKSEQKFLDMTKKVIKELARKSPPLRKELIEYLKQLAREHKKDTSIAHRALQELLSDISFSKPRGVGAAHIRTPQEIEKNVEKIIPLLVQALIARAHKEKVLLALDTELGPTEKVRELISKYVIDTLCEIHGNNGDIKVILKNLNIIDGKGKDLVQRIKAMTTKGKLKKENVIMITTESNLDNCSDFKEQAFITAVDDSSLSGKKEFDYYPLVELTFFTILRALAYDKDRIKKYQQRLWRWHGQIPNVEKLNFVDLMELCFDEDGNPKKTIILKLIPRAKKFEYKDLEKLYERIQEFIRKA